MQSGGAQECAQRSQPAQSELLVATAHGPTAGICTFAKAKALICCHRRRASGAFEGPPALKPVFDGPYACTVRQLGPRERRERKRAGNLFPKWLRRRGQSIPRDFARCKQRGARAPREPKKGPRRQQGRRHDVVVVGWRGITAARAPRGREDGALSRVRRLLLRPRGGRRARLLRRGARALRRLLRGVPPAEGAWGRAARRGRGGGRGKGESLS